LSLNGGSDLLYSDKAIPEEALSSLEEQKRQFSQKVHVSTQKFSDNMKAGLYLKGKAKTEPGGGER